MRVGLRMDKVIAMSISGATGKESVNAGDERDRDLIPGSGRSPGEGKDPTPGFLSENSMGRKAWRGPVHEAAKSWT